MSNYWKEEDRKRSDAGETCIDFKGSEDECELPKKKSLFLPYEHGDNNGDDDDTLITNKPGGMKPPNPTKQTYPSLILVI